MATNYHRLQGDARVFLASTGRTSLPSEADSAKQRVVQQVTIHAARTKLSRLIEAALAGEEVVIAKGSKPLVRLVPVARGKFRIGLLEGKLGAGPDFLAPMDEDELAVWEGSK